MQIIDGIKIKDNQLSCESHGSEYCMDCDSDYSDINLMYKAFSLNRGYLPPPNPETTKKVNELKKLGNDLFKKGEYAPAIDAYTKAIQFSRTRPIWDSPALVSEEVSILLSNRAACFLENNMVVNALYDSEIVTKIRPNWPKGHFRKGRALLALARYPEAVDSFDLALSLDPESKDIRHYLDVALDNI